MISHACVNDLLIAAYSNYNIFWIFTRTRTRLIVYDCRCLILDVPLPAPVPCRWRSAVRLLMAPMLVLKPLQSRPLPLLLLQPFPTSVTARPHLLLA